MNEYFKSIDEDEWLDSLSTYRQEILERTQLHNSQYFYTPKSVPSSPDIENFLLHKNFVNWIINFLKSRCSDEFQFLELEYIDYLESTRSIEKKVNSIYKDKNYEKTGGILTEISDVVNSISFNIFDGKLQNFTYFFYLTKDEWIWVRKTVRKTTTGFVRLNDVQNFACDGYWGFKKFLTQEFDNLNK